MKNLIKLFFILLIVSCNKKTNDINFNEIISFMIDKEAFPLIPPPALNDTTTINYKKFDSLYQTKLKIALYPALDSFSEKELKSIPEKYQDVFNIQNNSQEKIKLNELISEKGHQIILADTVELKKYKDFKDFDLLFWFSNFYFSKDNQKVLFTLGVSQSRLAGSSAIYVLKKEDEKWMVEYYKEHEIW
jgi:hypothetical protein|tara:strand:- start:90 stop:656 length:567 start_codon:yes stop_codon:yes gene_type:complete